MLVEMNQILKEAKVVLEKNKSNPGGMQMYQYLPKWLANERIDVKYKEDNYKP